MDKTDITLWFDDWGKIQAVVVSAVFFFFFSVLIMRVLGKRTTSQMNNFDWIISVAIGSLASSGILLKDTSIADAMVAIIVLAGCQWGLTRAVLIAPWVARMVKPTPRLLVYNGERLDDALAKERISTDELYGRLREHGHARLKDVKWVVLETDGRITVIPSLDDEIDLDSADLMGNVKGPEGLETTEEEDPERA